VERSRRLKGSGAIASGEIRGLLDLRNIELPRLAALVRRTADDVAASAVFLASVEAGYVTGHTLHVNGGMAMI